MLACPMVKGSKLPGKRATFSALGAWASFGAGEEGEEGVDMVVRGMWASRDGRS